LPLPLSLSLLSGEKGDIFSFPVRRIKRGERSKTLWDSKEKNNKITRRTGWDNGGIMAYKVAFFIGYFLSFERKKKRT
jgi:hypothetical protein